jgi:epoxyqueuosine reductase
VNSPERTEWVVAHARALGFDLCGVAPADGLTDLAHLDEWLARGYAGEMRYLHDPRRRDPQRVVEGARSIVVCAVNYNTSLPYSTETAPVAAGFTPATEMADMKSTATFEASWPHGWISRYAWGDDYHDVVGKMLDALLAAMRARFGEDFEARAYVDTGPVVERVVAKHAGLGWLGKNTCLINEELGSWLFLGVIVTTLELAPSAAPSGPPPDLCGNCRLCIEACPTGAIVEPYVLDARRCISYLTIELRGSIPEELRAPMGRHVFGCDICQDVCPYNRRAPVTQIAAFFPRSFEARDSLGAHVAAGFSPAESGAESPATGHYSLFTPLLEWLASVSEEDFREIFQGSPLRRTKWRGLVRNACVALGNALVGQVLLPVQRSSPQVGPGAESAHAHCDGIRTLLSRLADSPDPIIAEHAQWALRCLAQ